MKWVRWQGARRWHVLERAEGGVLVLACNRKQQARVRARSSTTPAGRVCEACRLIEAESSTHGRACADGEREVVPAVSPASAARVLPEHAGRSLVV
jgi:hypothetical protein